VLAGCKVGQYCRVTGTVASCADSGECVEVSNVIAVDGSFYGSTDKDFLEAPDRNARPR
jgi:hypothetical protein